MTMRSHSASINARLRSKPLSPTVVAAATRSRPDASLVAFGIGAGLLDILDRDQADAAPILVDHDQFLDPALMELPPRFLRRHVGTDRGEILAGHQLRDGLLRVFGESNVAIGDDADEPAVLLGHRNAGNAVLRHQLEHVGERLVGGHRDRVDDHAALEALDRPHRRRLLLDVEIAVEDADAAELRHRDRHLGLGHRIHRRGDDRDVEADLSGDARAHVRLARQHRRFGRGQQHVVEGQAERDFHGVCLLAAERANASRPRTAKAAARTDVPGAVSGDGEGAARKRRAIPSLSARAVALASGQKPR